MDGVAEAPNLVVKLSHSLNPILRATLKPDEKVLIALQGVYEEAPVCTDRRVLIIKTGYMTGHIFGNNILQLPYAAITGAQVNSHLMTGYFELLAGGIQNTPKSYWQDFANSLQRGRGTRPAQSPQRAPHCISPSRGRFQAFREASTFIMAKAEEARSPAAAVQSSSDPIGLLEQLGKLRENGILTDAEFEAKKAEILARV